MAYSWKSKCNTTLLWTAVIHMVLAIVCIGLSWIDSREVLSVPLWYKPFKFAISIAVYTLTLSYLVPFVQKVKTQKWIATGTAVAMFVEMVLIAMQAARGTVSHFNREDAFGIIVYAIMGVFILFASVLLVWLGITLARHKPESWTASYHQAIQMGIWLTVVGTVIGGYMSSRVGHTVGASDGGPGLPILNWSTLYGDWRVPHFIGLHAIQVFLLLGWILQKNRNARMIQWIVFGTYCILLLGAIVATYLGKPFV
jgi:hypothetical protein